MKAKDSYLLLLIFSLLLVFTNSIDLLIDPSLIEPVGITLFIILAILSVFKIRNYNNQQIYDIIILIVLAIMLIGESIILPPNMILYLLIGIITIGLFMFAHYSLKPENDLTKREKIILWTGLILFIISYFSLIGVILNNFTIVIIMGVFILILIAINRLIRRRRLKNNALKN